MQILSTIAAFRSARADYPKTLGLVPTMGFLHAGHLSLVERAKAECGAVAVSIFVNPTQFAAGEDLDRYPRDLERDLALLARAGTDLVFVPDAGELYPPGFATRIEVRGVTEVLEGAVRPGHFSGVATVVTKLFNIVQPSRAYFGQKDAQQCAVIQRFTRDLDIPVDIVIGGTVRDQDGLALSSRNAYLSDAQRAQAPALYRSLQAAAALFASGIRDGDALRGAMRTVIDAEPGLSIDYVSIADPLTLRELDQVATGALASLAVRAGQTRLLDNIVLTP